MLSDNLFYGNIPSNLASLDKLKILMINNNDIKGDFASLGEQLPKGVQFEFANIGERKNSALAGTD